jgi:hypothetical protein
MKSAWTVVNIVFALMFAFSVVVQYNDPDPVQWMMLYGSATLVCALEVRRGSVKWLAPAIAAIALVWALTIAPRVVGKVPFADMFGAFEMKNEAIEESREMYGLLIVVVWMTIVAIASRRRSAGTIS